MSIVNCQGRGRQYRRLRTSRLRFGMFSPMKATRFKINAMYRFKANQMELLRRVFQTNSISGPVLHVNDFVPIASSESDGEPTNSYGVVIY